MIHASTKSACASDRQVLAVFSENHCSMIHVPQSVSRHRLLYEPQLDQKLASPECVSSVKNVFVSADGRKTCPAGQEYLSLFDLQEESL